MGLLNRVRLEGYKSIKDMDLELERLNILIGANGAGKSNLISCFTLLNQIVRGRLSLFVQRSGGAETMLHFGQKVTERIKIGLDFGSNSYEIALIPTESDSLVFESEDTIFHHTTQRPGPYRKHLGVGHSESKLGQYAEWGDAVPKHVLSSLESWKFYHFHDTSSSAKVRKPGNINDNAELRHDASNLAAYLYRLNKQFPKHYKLLVKSIRMVAPFFEDFVLRPDPLTTESIRLEWSELGSDIYMNAMSLSDGTLRFICLAAALQQPNELRPASIIIDEPELGLHPYAIVILAGLIKQASTKMQVIVSTQSVQLVNQFEPKDLVIVNLSDGASHFSRLDSSSLGEWLAEYSLGELWEKNILGGRPSK
jgi:predicted ATPase